METAEKISLAELIGQLAAELEFASSTGDMAELRRLDTDRPGGPAFWRIVVAQLDASIPGDGQGRVEALRRWAVILRTMAQMAGLHDPRTPFGVAAAQAGVSEMRMLKLLRASGGGLFDSVRMVAHQLATAGFAANIADVASLVLSDGRADEAPVRERIAYHYYAQLRRTEKEGA